MADTRANSLSPHAVSIKNIILTYKFSRWWPVLSHYSSSCFSCPFSQFFFNFLSTSCLILTTDLLKLDSSITPMPDSGQRLSDGYQSAAMSRAAQVVRYPSNTLQSIHAIWREVETLGPSARGKGCFETIKNTFVTENRPTSRTRSTLLPSSNNLDSTICE